MKFLANILRKTYNKSINTLVYINKISHKVEKWSGAALYERIFEDKFNETNWGNKRTNEKLTRLREYLKDKHHIITAEDLNLIERRTLEEKISIKCKKNFEELLK